MFPSRQPLKQRPRHHCPHFLTHLLVKILRFTSSHHFSEWIATAISPFLRDRVYFNTKWRLYAVTITRKKILSNVLNKIDFDFCFVYGISTSKGHLMPTKFLKYIGDGIWFLISFYYIFTYIFCGSFFSM